MLGNDRFWPKGDIDKWLNNPSGIAAGYSIRYTIRMCGRVNVSDHPAIQSLMKEMGLPLYPEQDFHLSAKLFPYYKPILAGFYNSDRVLDAALMNWGWVRDWDKGHRLFNSRRVSAKGQPIWDSRVWGQSIRERRCLIPINAFYEWDENFPKGKRPRYRIESANGPAMALGGIYEINQDGEMCMSICTTDPNEKMKKIHHRMPVIIRTSDAEEWLKSDDTNAVDQLMAPTSDDWIELIKEN